MSEIAILSTGIPNLDSILGGGFPIYSLNAIAGAPGSGKTTLVQQIMFNTVRAASSPETKALYLSTLSEPAVKVVRYMQSYEFFDPDLFDERVLYRDIGNVVAHQALDRVAACILELVGEHKPEILTIDSFKAIRDVNEDSAAFRRFCFDLSVRLAGARCTTFLINESDRQEITSTAEFAVADGILYLNTAEQAGKQTRFLQVLKLRGAKALMEPFPYALLPAGVQILSPALTLRNSPPPPVSDASLLETGIVGLDRLLHGGIPRGRSIILSGVSGTGKTTFALQFLIEGTRRGERGLLFSFEESIEALSQTAAGFGWDLPGLVQAELLQIVFVPQTEIRVEEQLERIIAAAESFAPERIVLDSLSAYLYRTEDPALQRDATFFLATLLQRTRAVGVFLSDIPSDRPDQLSRYGVEETIADGTIVLSMEMVGRRRHRFLEVAKMRTRDYVSGRHRIEITPSGVEIFYLPLQTTGVRPQGTSPRTLSFNALKGLIADDLSYDATWLVRGEPGLGKSTLAAQFAIEGLRRQEAVLYVSADVPFSQTLQLLQRGFGFLPEPYIEAGQLAVLDGFGSDRTALDLTDPDAFLFQMRNRLETLPRPCRVVIDSLTPLAIALTPQTFISLVYDKNRLLRESGVVIFDILLAQVLPRSNLYSLLNAFDVALELYTPNWGDMNQQGDVGYPSLRVLKARGTRADMRPYPFAIAPRAGVILQKYYQMLS